MLTPVVLLPPSLMLISSFIGCSGDAGDQGRLWVNFMDQWGLEHVKSVTYGIAHTIHGQDLKRDEGTTQRGAQHPGATGSNRDNCLIAIALPF